MIQLRAGDLLHIDRAASVQFAVRPILYRVIRELPHVTYAGWVWLDGYELTAAGDAAERRQVFVQRAGLRRVRAGLPQTAAATGRGMRR